MAVEEIRIKMTLELYCIIKFDGKIEKKENYVEFMADLDALRIRKGDFLIGVNAKDQSRSTDVRQFEQEKLDELLSNAMRGKYLILRIVKRDHEDYEKILHVQRESNINFFIFLNQRANDCNLSSFHLLNLRS